MHCATFSMECGLTLVQYHPKSDSPGPAKAEHTQKVVTVGAGSRTQIVSNVGEIDVGSKLEGG